MAKAMMNAVMIEHTGGPDVLQYRQTTTPTIGNHEILIRLEAIGVNFIDVYHRVGLYAKDLPFVPGLEGAGLVVDAGENVADLAVGDRVAFSSIPGAYAEYVVAPADKVVKVPPNIEANVAAALMLQGMTAHYLTQTTYPLKSGDVALVHAAAGGVGLLLVQMAKKRGALVIGTVSTEDKAELARQAGADHVILYGEVDFEREVRSFTRGEGVNVIYDSVGKTTFEKGLNLLKPLGYMVLFGQSSGPVGPLDPQLLNQKGSLFLTRPSLFHYIATRDEFRKRAGDVLNWSAAGDLFLHIGQTFPLAQAAEAHRQLEARQTTGKVLLLP